jgi:ADP-heptose:LPS heptosyltransferase
MPFGIDPNKKGLRIRYATSSESDRFSMDVIKHLKLIPGKIIGINISAGHDVRFWGVDNFRALIAYLQHRHRSAKILVLFKPSHIGQAEQIVHGIQHAYASPVTETFDQFAALIKNLGLLITPDTSAVHLAAAFGVPSIVMYVQSDKNLRIWDPYGSPSELLVSEIDDLRRITPEMVIQSVDKILRRHPLRARRMTGSGLTRR